MSPHEMALKGLIALPFDIIKICDTGDGWNVRKNAISALKDLEDSWAVKA